MEFTLDIDFYKTGENNIKYVRGERTRNKVRLLKKNKYESIKVEVLWMFICTSHRLFKPSA